MTARVMPWVAAVLLATFGWYALAPVWAQGLGGVTVGSDGQPALWMGGVRAGWFVVLAAMGSCLWFWPKPDGGRRSAFVRARAAGICGVVTVMILYLVMAGQPLRLWFLLAHGEWNSPFTAGGAALLASGVFFASAGRLQRAAAALLTMVTAGAVAGIITPFSPEIAFPACIDWAVLAFALSCGAFAAWMAPDGMSEENQAQDRQKDF